MAQPFVIINQASGLEDSAVNFGIFALPVDANNFSSATNFLTIEIQGLVGWTPDLNDPVTAGGTFDPNTGTWTTTLAPGQALFSGPIFTPPENSDVDNLNTPVIVHQFDSTNGNALIGTLNTSFDIVIDAVADSATVNTGIQSVTGTQVHVPVTVSLDDNDGSEEVTQVTLSGLPADVSVPGGTQLLDGDWVFDPRTLSDFNISSGGVASFSIPIEMSSYAGGAFNMGLTVTNEETALSGVEFIFGNNTNETGIAIDVQPVCFQKGTMILTAKGERPIETLDVGDMVMTADHGAQAILMIEKQRFALGDIQADERKRPIIIQKDAFGQGRPAKALIVSQQHRIEISGKDFPNRCPDMPPSFVAAKHLVGVMPGVRYASDHKIEKLGGVEYWHILCQNHEVLIANGMLAESLFLGAQYLKNLTAEQAQEIEWIMGENFSTDRPMTEGARPFLTGGEFRRNLGINNKHTKRPDGTKRPRLTPA